MSATVHTVVAPLMGTFYRAAAPGEPPLVEVGQVVAAGDFVCVLESMKIFTELRTNCAGRVKAILLENEDAVMKNQPLIEIEANG